MNICLISVQVECAQNIWNLLHGSKLAQLHEDEVGIDDDRYLLRQDRYPLRTAPQFLGPQIEDILSALAAITQECNSSKYIFVFSILLLFSDHNYNQLPTIPSSRLRPVIRTTVGTSKRCQSRTRWKKHGLRYTISERFYSLKAPSFVIRL